MDEKEPRGLVAVGQQVMDIPRGTLKSTKEVVGSRSTVRALKLCVRRFFKMVSEDFEGSVKSALTTCGRQYLVA